MSDLINKISNSKSELTAFLTKQGFVLYLIDGFGLVYEFNLGRNHYRILVPAYNQSPEFHFKNIQPFIDSSYRLKTTDQFIDLLPLKIKKQFLFNLDLFT